LKKYFIQLAVLAVLSVFPIKFCLAVDIKKVESRSGSRAWLVQNPAVPVISMSFAFRSGAVSDPAGKEGRAQFVASMLDEGAGDLNSAAFREKIEDLSVRLRFRANLETFSGSIQTLKQNRAEAFKLLALALNKPRFDQDAFLRVRAQLIASLRLDQEDPNRIASRLWYRSVFGNHPYGRPIGGTSASISNIKREDLVSFSNSFFSRNNLLIGVAGDISPDELSMRLDEIFGRLPQGSDPKILVKPEIRMEGKTIVVEKSLPQSVAIFGHRGFKRTDSEWYAAYIVNKILGGGGFSSRLMEEVREKRGLAYGVYSWLNPFESVGLIMGSVATSNSRVKESLDIIREEWRKMSKLAISEEELQEAKNYINGSFPLRLDSSRRIAQILLAVQVNRLGIEYLNRRSSLINSVSRDQVKKTAKRLLDPRLLTVVVVGQPEGISSSK
jgi:zinc protease